MPTPLSPTLKRRVIELAFVERRPNREIAKILGVSLPTINKWKKQHKEAVQTRLKHAWTFLQPETSPEDKERGLRYLRVAIAMLGLGSVGDD